MNRGIRNCPWHLPRHRRGVVQAEVVLRKGRWSPNLVRPRHHRSLRVNGRREGRIPSDVVDEPVFKDRRSSYGARDCDLDSTAQVVVVAVVQTDCVADDDQAAGRVTLQLPGGLIKCRVSGTLGITGHHECRHGNWRYTLRVFHSVQNSPTSAERKERIWLNGSWALGQVGDGLEKAGN